MAFIVYDRVLVNSSVPVVDKSRSIEVFASVQKSIEEQMPTDAPGWIKQRYEQLVGDCGAPTTGTGDIGTGTGSQTGGATGN